MLVRIVRYTFGSLLIVLLVAIVLVLTLDFGRFKSHAEVLVSHLLNRELVIEGAAHLTIGRNIEFSASNTKLASSKWSMAESLVSFRHIKASVNIWSLISGPIRLESLVLDGLRINLEEIESGENNWTLIASPDQDSNPTYAPPSEDSRDSPLLPILPLNINITDAMLSYHSPDIEQDLLVVIDKAQEVINESDDTQFILNGKINKIPVNLNATAGKVSHIVDYSEVEFNVNGAVGDVRIDAIVAIDDLSKPSRPTVSVSINGPKIERLTQALGIKQVTTGPLKLDMQVKPVDQKMQLDLAATLGEFTVLANGKFTDLQKLQDIALQVSASGPDIGHFSRLLGLPGKLDGPFELEATIAQDESQNANILLKVDAGDIALNMESSFIDAQNFTGSKAKIRLQAANFDRIADAFAIEHLTQQSIDLSAVIERVDAGITIKKGLLVFGKDQLSFSGVVGNDPLKPGTDIRFKSTMPNIQDTLSGFKIDVKQIPDGELIAAGQILGGDKRIAIRDLSLSLAGAKAELQADLTLTSILSDSKINFSVKGDDLSDLLSSSDQYSVPAKAFTLNGAVVLKANTATIPNLKFKTGNNQLSAEIILGLEPALKSLRAKITASGPNLNELSPYFNDISAVEAAPFDLRSDIVWSDGLLKINAFLGKVGKASFEISGRLQNPPNFNNTNLRLVADIDDMHNLSVIAGRELPHAPAGLKIHFQGKGNTITTQEFDGRIGDSDVSGDLFYRAGEIPEFNLKLVSKRFDLSPYLPVYERVDEQPTAQKQTDAKVTSKHVADSNTAQENASASAKNKSNRVIPETPIPIELLQGFSANIDMRIQELIIRQHAARNLVFSAVVSNGALQVDKFAVETISGGEINGRFDVTPKHGGAQIWGTLTGKKLIYGLPYNTEEEFKTLPRYGIDMAFLTVGSNQRELASALNGYLKLISGKGKLKAGSMQMFTNDFLFELLNKVNPFGEGNSVANLKCTVILATVEQGKLIGDPALVIESDRINIFANAHIDLGSEELDVNFNMIPQKGLGLSMSNLVNPYIKVGGNFSSPSLQLNPESAIIEGGAAVATGGLSILILGLKNRFLSDENPCDTTVAETHEQFSILAEKYKNPPSSVD